MLHDVQLILRQYLQEYAEVKETITSILAQLDALEQRLES